MDNDDDGKLSDYIDDASGFTQKQLQENKHTTYEEYGLLVSGITLAIIGIILIICAIVFRDDFNVVLWCSIFGSIGFLVGLYLTAQHFYKRKNKLKRIS